MHKSTVAVLNTGALTNAENVNPNTIVSNSLKISHQIIFNPCQKGDIKRSMCMKGEQVVCFQDHSNNIKRDSYITLKKLLPAFQDLDHTIKKNDRLSGIYILPVGDRSAVHSSIVNLLLHHGDRLFVIILPWNLIISHFAITLVYKMPHNDQSSSSVVTIPAQCTHTGKILTPINISNKFTAAEREWFMLWPHGFNYSITFWRLFLRNWLSSLRTLRIVDFLSIHWILEEKKDNDSWKNITKDADRTT